MCWQTIVGVITNDIWWLEVVVGVVISGSRRQSWFYEVWIVVGMVMISCNI